MGGWELRVDTCLARQLHAGLLAVGRVCLAWIWSGAFRISKGNSRRGWRVSSKW